MAAIRAKNNLVNACDKWIIHRQEGVIDSDQLDTPVPQNPL
jgi:hypothetical protein